MNSPSEFPINNYSNWIASSSTEMNYRNKTNMLSLTYLYHVKSFISMD